MLGLSKNEFVVLGAGQLAGRKGIDDFIEIAAEIPEVRFVWAGGRPFGGLTEGISRINEKLSNSGQNFIYAGEIKLEDMPYIYAASDLMLFPSFQENCPLAPIEAAACGLPVIYRDIEEYRLLYEHPYLKASDKTEFISLTRRMIADRDFYNEGVNISRQLLAQFDKEIIRKKLISIYRELLNKSESPVILPRNLKDVPVELT